MNRNIVITGMSGCIGQVLYSALRSSWSVSGVDIRSVDGVQTRPVDVRDTESLISIFDGAYAVIHLAANANFRGSWQDVEEPNVRGTESVFEAARISGVHKMIFASSNHVTGLYERDDPYRAVVAGDYDRITPDTIRLIDHSFPVRPDSFYGVSKACGENLARYYAETCGIRSYCIRIGTVNRPNRPLDTRQYSTLLTHNDLAGLITACLNNETVYYGIFYGVSENTWKIWDTSNLRRDLEWSPVENAESFR